jgi:hypothetical protein
MSTGQGLSSVMPNKMSNTPCHAVHVGDIAVKYTFAMVSPNSAGT